ncbi:MAG: TRAP transporter large permease [Thermoleophilia bacterium]|nr:TRAP transporter large permease [Thermoleophilia bacterium]
MSPIEIGIVGMVALFALLFTGVPVGVALAVVGFVGFGVISGFDSALGLLKIVPYSTFADYGLTVIPLFILMGNFAYHSGMSGDLYGTARAWFGRVRGGLAMSTVAACAAFGAVCGSSTATAATMGKIALPEMKKHGYDDRLSTGTLAAGGTLGILIPPSVIMIIYGVLTSNSIGRLFLAGFLPGILQALFYIVVVGAICLIFKERGPAGQKMSIWSKIKSLRHSWAVLILFALVIGGIYFGLFTPIEAAGVGAFGAFAIALLRRKLTWVGFKNSLTDSVQTSAMIFIIMLGANIFGYFLAVTRLPQALSDSLLGMDVSRYWILLIIMIIYVVLGMFMDSMAMILVTLPIFYPVIQELGFHPIWFGIIVVRVAEIGLITPPVGMNLYVIQGIADKVPMGTVFRGATPFVMADLVHVAVLVAFPVIATFLPDFMMG